MVTYMLHYGKTEFQDRDTIKTFVQNRMVEYWKSHNDSFSAVCEDLDSYDGFLGDDRYYSMDDIDDILGEKKPSEILEMVDSDFSYSDDYFYFDGYGELCSSNEKRYFDKFDYTDVFEKLLNEYGQIFTANYGCDYYDVFSDLEDLLSDRYTDSEIQEMIDDDSFSDLFDEYDFMANDDLD